MMLSPKAAALSDRGFCPIALPVPYVALISSEGTLFPRPELGVTYPRILPYGIAKSESGDARREDPANYSNSRT